MPELKCYAILYTSYSQGGPGVSLALTKNFKDFEHYGMILPPEDKDAAIFPKRFGNIGQLFIGRFQPPAPRTSGYLFHLI